MLECFTSWLVKEDRIFDFEKLTVLEHVSDALRLAWLCIVVLKKLPFSGAPQFCKRIKKVKQALWGINYIFSTIKHRITRWW